MKKFAFGLFLACVSIAAAQPPQVSPLLGDGMPQISACLTECVCGPDCPKGGCVNCDCEKFVAVVSRGASCANGSCGVASAPATRTAYVLPTATNVSYSDATFASGGSCANGSCGSSGTSMPARRTLFGGFFRRR